MDNISNYTLFSLVDNPVNANTIVDNEEALYNMDSAINLNNNPLLNPTRYLYDPDALISGINVIAPSSSEINGSISRDISDLLKQWGLEVLENLFKENHIDLEVLKQMRLRHVYELTKNCDLGIRIKLESKVFNWQKEMGTYEQDNALYPTQSEQPHTPKDTPVNEASANKNVLDNLTPSLATILESCSEGKALIEISKKKEDLTSNQRVLLGDIIVRYFMENSKHMSVGQAVDLSEMIVDFFPNEIKESYCAPRLKQPPKGILYNKFHNNIRKMEKCGLKTTKKQNKKVKPTELSNMLDNIENLEESLDIMKKLQTIGPSLPWEELKSMWIKSASLRKQKLFDKEDSNSDAILKEWPCYKLPYGSALIEMDFDIFFKDKNPKSFFDMYDLFKNSIIEECKDKIKDKHCKEIIKQAEEEKDEDKKAYQLFRALHGMLVPKNTKIIRKENKKIHKKYTIMDSQLAFIMTGSTVAEINEKINKKKLEKSSDMEGLQPLVICLLEEQSSSFYVYFDDYRFSYFSFLAAVDACFKIYQIFNLKYSPECIAVWQFIQQLFFNLYFKCDEIIINNATIIKSLKKKHAIE